MTVPDLSQSLTDSQKININIISLNTRMNEMQTEVNTLNKVILLGNGEIPLREQVRNHEEVIQSIKYWTRFVFGALLAQTLTFGVAIIISVVKFLPILEKLASKP